MWISNPTVESSHLQWPNSPSEKGPFVTGLSSRKWLLLFVTPRTTRIFSYCCMLAVPSSDLLTSPHLFSVTCPSTLCKFCKYVHVLCLDGLYWCRLGSLNSRLVRSYCEFDQRVTPLISVLKLWSQVVGIPKKQLNSYGISLMVIYFLQRCDPPVLPCLQSSDQQWPRNMQWYGQALWREEAARNESVRELVAPWDVSFTSHKAFLPSTNTASTGMPNLVYNVVCVQAVH